MTVKETSWTISIFENIIAERSPSLGKERDIQAQETRSRQSQTGSTPKRTTTSHIVIKTAKIKDKERILKAARGDFPGSPVAPKIRTLEHVKEILTDIKREIDIKGGIE